eukprot:TRINITY_DN3441_c0_g1_i2.p1 TRINITY_DN3441_c0_g1~~TRINITY_DN3441_c0_g1_i2.p1  ORF type:complete len:605 (+),score=141.33 TRINITY_DN3441_c0_g1_i2:71-1816(+)
MDYTPDIETDMWCSWCLKQGDVTLLKENIFSRDIYRCNHCANELRHCATCDVGMARNTVEGADKLCAQCCMTIDQWGDQVDLAEQGWCSWCFKNTSHSLVRSGIISRDTRQCSECHRRTRKCRMCGDGPGEACGMARGDDHLCYVCNSRIKSWDDEEKKNLRHTSRKGWCSWCIEYTVHTLDEGSIITRNKYTCRECGGGTAPCILCDCAMTRSDQAWTSASCECCEASETVINAFKRKGKKDGASTTETDSDKGESASLINSQGMSSDEKAEEKTKRWLDLQERKHKAYPEEATPESIRALLLESSGEKDLAKEAGLIRPFQLLVSMSPKLRMQVASMLGWCLVTSEAYGSPHQEAWEILIHHSKGIAARSETLSEKFDAFDDDTPYSEIMRRVIEEVFHMCTCPRLSPQEGNHVSSSPSDPQMSALEDELIRNIGFIQRRNMTEEQRAQQDVDMASADSQRLLQIVKHANITSIEAQRVAVDVIKDVLKMDKLQMTVIGMEIFSALIPGMGMVLGPTVAGLSALIPPVAIIGALGAVAHGAVRALGPTYQRLCAPLVVITAQKLVLASQDIEFEEYLVC